MFLHSGASLHGHEYSNRPAPGAGPALNRRSPLLRSPFAAPLTRSATAPPSALQSRSLSPPAARLDMASQSQQQLQSCLPQRPSRTRRVTAEEQVVRFQEPLEVADVVEDKHKPIISPTSTAAPSEDEGSCSEASDAGSGSARAVGRTRRRHRQRLPRKSSVFFIARPAPKLIKKRLMKRLVRPKLLLQLHHLSVDKRPTPLLDIFPASTIAAQALGGRLANRFPRVFGVMGDRSELGSQDVIILRSEEYSTAEDCAAAPMPEDDDEENLNRRDLVAVLSPLRREDRTEIVLDDGNVWVAEPLANGSFEFTHTNAHGVSTTARWVRRSLAKGTTPASPLASAHPCSESSNPASASNPWATTVDEYKYTFSIIDPLSRRHPIMATLTQETLDVLENYTTVSSSCGKYPPSRPFGPSHSQPASSDEEDDDEDGGAPLPKPQRRSKPVDAATRNIISITAVWVTLRLGGIMPPSTERSGSLRSSAVSRARNGSHGGAPKSPVCSNGTNPAHIRREDTASPGPQAPAVGGGASLPRRATSTGAAFMQRRIQMSDASDSERTAVGAPPSGLRSKGRRVLSGDWNMASWKRSSTPQPVTATAVDIVGMSPVLPREPQSPRRIDQSSTWPISSSRAASPLGGSRPGSSSLVPEHVSRPRAERQVQSAVYVTSPAAVLEVADLTGQVNQETAAPAPVDPNSPAGALAALEGGTDVQGPTGRPSMDTATRPERGWKRLSGWLRRFGR